MLNPLIHRHPADTLHCVYSMLDFLETLPGEAGAHTELSHTQIFGLFCMLECLKGALQFEGDRVTRTPPPDAAPPHPAALVRRLKAVKHPVLRRRLLSEFAGAVALCEGGEDHR